MGAPRWRTAPASGLLPPRRAATDTAGGPAVRRCLRASGRCWRTIPALMRGARTSARSSLPPALCWIRNCGRRQTRACSSAPGDIHLLHCAPGDDAALRQEAKLSTAGADVHRLPAGNRRTDFASRRDGTAGGPGIQRNPRGSGRPCSAARCWQRNSSTKWSCIPHRYLLGDGAAGLFRLAPLEDMSQRPSFRVLEAGRVGPDVRLILAPAHSADRVLECSPASFRP